MRAPFFARHNKTRGQKEKIEDQVPHNAYYETVSVRFGLAQVILYLSLLAYVVLAFFTNTELITYQNFYHFFRDLNAGAEQVDIFGADSLSYPTAKEQSFALYRKGLAVAGNNNVTIFSATGRQTLGDSVDYRKPVAVGAGRYLLVYELGGTQYSLYDSNTQMYSAKSEFPIYGGTVSDSGSYALITGSTSYTTVVTLYNNRFSMINRFSKNGYVMGVALDAKGETVALLTSTPKDGAFQTDLLLCRVGQSSAIAESFVGNAVGISCAFTASGSVAVLCSDGVSFVSGRGDVSRVCDFEGKILTSSDLGKDGVAVCLKKNVVSEKNIVIVFDKTGKIVYNDVVSYPVDAICRTGNAVHWTTVDGVCRLDLKRGEIGYTSCKVDGRVLLSVDEDEVLLCSPQKAEYVAVK